MKKNKMTKKIILGVAVMTLLVGVTTGVVTRKIDPPTGSVITDIETL